MIGPIFWIVILFLNLRWGSAVVYRLNASVFEKFPPVFYTEPYEKCMADPDAVYCATELVPVSDTPSPLLDLIHEYSAHTTTHYNHSLNNYGICLSSCKHAQNTTRDLRYTLEACLNDTYWTNYGLKTNLQEYVRCSTPRKQIEMADILFLVAVGVILLMNFVGTLCDVHYLAPKVFGLRLLTLFSIRRNWKKLISPAAEGPEPRLKDLKGLAAAKVITTVFVILAHTLVSVMFSIDNPGLVEDYYSYNFAHFLLNGPLVVQTFFIITGFLLAYNLLLFSENHEIGWSLLPKGILLRWFRLTPLYAFLLFLTVTWLPRLGAGPAWDKSVTDEANDCREYWWQNLLYINNYNNVSQCYLQSWYLAADTQLYCLGLVVFIACRSVASRKVVLSVLLLLGLVISPLQTYLQDLDGVLIVSPEVIIHFFKDSPNYNHLYKSTQSNLFPYAIGLTAGYLVYHLQNIKFDIQKYKKYRCIFWICIPLGFVVVWSGTIFYRDGPRPSMLIRVAYALLIKPIYNFLLFIGLLVIVFKYEKIINYVLESQVWTVLSRLCYSAFLVHVPLLRLIMGSRHETVHASIMYTSQQIVHLEVISFVAALPCFLLVEQPFSQLMKALLT